MKNKLTFKEGSVATFAMNEESGKRTFSMTGYTGAPMRAFGNTSVIIDLEGMSMRNEITPIFQHHDSTKIVGHATASVGASVMLDGEISGVGEAAKEVAETAENGFPWQASVGVNILKANYLEAGDDDIEVNGHMMSAPAIILSQTELFETSFVPLGRDGDTSVKFSDEEDIKSIFSKNPEKEINMENEEKVTLKEMRSAFSENLDFACDCYEEGLTLVEAKAKFADILASEVTELKAEVAELKAAKADLNAEGADPVEHLEAGLGKEPELSKKEQAEAKLEELKESGMSHNQAVVELAAKFPKLMDELNK